MDRTPDATIVTSACTSNVWKVVLHLERIGGGVSNITFLFAAANASAARWARRRRASRLCWPSASASCPSTSSSDVSVAAAPSTAPLAADGASCVESSGDVSDALAQLLSCAHLIILQVRTVDGMVAPVAARSDRRHHDDCCRCTIL